ncbi:hypothetical protein BTM36_11985 [Herbaspirillum sp. VT-16-41]|nr:hypothetical protein BTM36_11985 [Herbaspirillum sp. VT-16-41]
METEVRAQVSGTDTGFRSKLHMTSVIVQHKISEIQQFIVTCWTKEGSQGGGAAGEVRKGAEDGAAAGGGLAGADRWQCLSCQRWGRAVG